VPGLLLEVGESGVLGGSGGIVVKKLRPYSILAVCARGGIEKKAL